jgi:hypothetical protein
MNAPGCLGEDGSLHFLSNFSRGEREGAGFVNVYFENDQVTVIYADVDRAQNAPPSMEFIWNSKLGGCSDFPGSTERCKSDLFKAIVLRQLGGA